MSFRSAACLSACLALLLATTASAEETVVWKILFNETNQANYEAQSLQVIDEDGSNRIELFNVSAWQAQWSPDATKIAFVPTDQAVNREIYVVDADGSNPTNLTLNTFQDEDPQWSPDGTKIAFYSYRPGPDHAVYLMNSDGSNETKLVDGGAYPRWSPDGTKILYSMCGQNGCDLHVISADGTGDFVLVGGLNTHPGIAQWSPDGSKVVLAWKGDAQIGGPWISEIYLVDALGTNLTRLSDEGERDQVPSWSPDGSTIAFTSRATARSEIYLMDSDGSNRRSLVSDALADNWSPNWDGTGSKIVFASQSQVSPYIQRIYRVDVDGQNKLQLTFDGHSQNKPLYSPVRLPIFPDTDGDLISDAADSDDDNDGLSDEEEALLGTDRLVADTDGDGIGDSEDAFGLDPTETTDTDNDGIGNNADPDDDNDELSDELEAVLGTDPLVWDTDADRMSDGYEYFHGTDPLVYLPSLTPIPLSVLAALLLTLGVAFLGLRRRTPRP